MKKLDIKEERVPKRSEGPVIGVYVVEIPESPFFYIGSSGNLFERAKAHKRELQRGKHHSEKLQGLYDHEQEMSVTVLQKAATRDEAYDIEQELLDLHLNNPFCLNLSASARNSNLLRPSVLAEPDRDRINKGSTARPVVGDGVEYPSIKAAARALGLDPASIRDRIKNKGKKSLSWSYRDNK